MIRDVLLDGRALVVVDRPERVRAQQAFDLFWRQLSSHDPLIPCFTS
jgi:hypothetical protein